MKKTLLMAFIFIFSCKEDENRRSGVCYCLFFNGEKKEFDLNHLSPKQQIDTCSLHDTNASFFGGKCELE